ncbi:LysR family transcriptional regulator [Burkholderiaceae bacterium UC74_6]
MLKLEGIASFVAVAEAGSISEAARRLHLSKSVVSERLADMESSLGARLLHRTTRRISLTEDGAAFLERASRILREMQEATAEISERRGTLSGPLRISAPVTFGRRHLGPALCPFLLANPAIELTLDLDDRRVDVSAAGYDAVIRNGTIEDSRLVAWTLAPSRRVLVASPAYLDRHGVPKDVEALRAHRGIFYVNRGVADWQFAGNAGMQSVRGKVALRTNNGDMMLDAALAGIGIALLPSFIAGEAIGRGDLVPLDVGAQAAEEFIYVAHPEGRHASVKLRAMTEALREAIGSPPYWDAWQTG